MRYKRKNSFTDLYRYYERPEKLSDKIKNNTEVISFVTAVIGILVALVIGIAGLSDNTNDCKTQQESIPIVKELEVYQVYYHELGLALVDDEMKKTSQELLHIAREVYFNYSNNILIIIYRIG